MDGTLTDPMIGITKSVQYALKSYGIEEPKLQKLTPFIGPPLKDSFMKYYGFSEDQAMEAVWKYREYFSVTGLYENQAYNGIEELLRELKMQRKTVILATSKPELFARQILEHFHLDGYFDLICGASMDETRVRKTEVIAYAMDAAGIGPEEVRKAVMTGDREHDILGAKEHHMASVGVLYGYGSREELQKAGAGSIVETVEELRQVLCGC